MSGCHEKAKSEVEIMWTNQHGTGPETDDRVETQVILQYMCQAYPDDMFTDVNKVLDVNDYEYYTIRNGQSSGTQSAGYGQPESSYISKDLGLHEPYHYYEAYYRRERNKGEHMKIHPQKVLNTGARWVPHKLHTQNPTKRKRKLIIATHCED